MPYSCIYPGCGLKRKLFHQESFHELPYRHNDQELLQQWMVVLNMDIATPVETLKKKRYRVCSRHFDKDDFIHPKTAKESKRVHRVRVQLRRNAIPRVGPPADTVEELQKKNATCQRLPRQEEQRESENKENRVQADEDEESNTSLSVGDGHYMVDLGSSSELIVDEECILELFKKCRKCNRQCTVRKNVTGLKLVVNQTCCFCQHHFRWTNLPDEDYDKDDSDSQINGQNVAMSPSSNTS
ncbi:uncharacterized protein PAE49_004488 isoform 1-T1 [Odontesthes bonariensis]|uniref:uncharacterized protein LOC142378920 isoform X1 n=1 Tax=Odontesthes bonariensis TaxID=219752 RepID=UPI003F580BE8